MQTFVILQVSSSGLILERPFIAFNKENAHQYYIDRVNGAYKTDFKTIKDAQDHVSITPLPEEAIYFFEVETGDEPSIPLPELGTPSLSDIVMMSLRAGHTKIVLPPANSCKGATVTIYNNPQPMAEPKEILLEGRYKMLPYAQTSFYSYRGTWLDEQDYNKAVQKEIKHSL